MMRDGLALETLLGARVAEGDARGCAALLIAENEKARRALAPHSERLLREHQQLRPDGETAAQRVRRLDVIRLIAFATFAESDLTKQLHVYVPASGELADIVCDVLVARWRDGSKGRQRIADYIYTTAGYWALSCRLEERGIAPPPPRATRLLSFIWGASSTCASLTDLLRTRADLRLYVWLFFDWATAADAVHVHDGKRKGRGFVDAIVALAGEGLLARGQLLDATLDALARDGGAAAWFRELHDRLEPDVGERGVRSEAYARLLGCRSDSSFDVARTAIVTLAHAGALSPERLTTTVEEILHRTKKDGLRRLLRALDEAAAASPTTASAVCALAAPALRRESADDQAMALKVIERHGDAADAKLIARIRECLPYVAASNRERVAKLLGDTQATAQEVATIEGYDEDALRERAGALPGPWRRLAAVDAAWDALETGTVSIAPLTLDPLTIPRLHSPIEPIRDLDELIDECLGAIEGGKGPDDLERILDGIARMCRLRPDEFEARAAPLRHRCTERLDEALEGPLGGAMRPFMGYRSLHDLMAVILAWLEGDGDRRTTWSGPIHRWLPPKHAPEEAREILRSLVRAGVASVLVFHSAHLARIALRAADGEVAPLLSTPTHRGGFIDPRVLVQRAAKHAPRDRVDAIIPVLPLAPEHRAESLEPANEVAGEFGAALRHALGGDEAIGPDAALWYAAARARSPIGDDAAVDARHPDGGPDAANAARYAIDATRFPNLERGAGMAMVGGATRPFRVEPPFPESISPDRFPSVWHVARLAWVGGATTSWETSLWPTCAAPVFAREAFHLSYFIESEGTYWQGDWEPLFDPDMPLGVPGALHVALGLAARHATQNKLAEDALVAAIDEGRVSATLLGSAMAAILRWGAITISRWTRALREVASISALHLHFVMSAVAHAFAEASPHPPTVRPLVELLREWVVESGEPVADLRCREWLGTIGGSGKVASAARALLAPAATDPTRHRRAVAVRVLANRIDRAARWSAGSTAASANVAPTSIPPGGDTPVHRVPPANADKGIPNS